MAAFQKTYMEMAFEIAFSALGTTSPNPSVGTVIVRNDAVISTGGTCPSGGDHAEIVAIRNARGDIRGSEMYVSLEPCCHYGRTPPCTEAIIEAGISRVYVPILDPNPLVAGKGIMRLREAGVDVVMVNEMAGTASDLIRHFKKSVLRKRSYIIHKSALTLDGRIATPGGESKWISSIYSRYIAHRVRSIVDGILIGKGTFIQDNPTLNVRLDSFPDDVKSYVAGLHDSFSGRESLFLKLLFGGKELGDRSPMRILLGLPRKLDLTDNLFFDDNFLIAAQGEEELLAKRDDYSTVKRFLDAGQMLMTKGESRSEQIHHLVEELARRGKTLLMLEGGSRVAGSFFDAGEIDQFLYFISPRIFGGGVPLMAGEGVQHVADAPLLHDMTTVMIRGDILCNAYKEPYHFEMM